MYNAGLAYDEFGGPDIYPATVGHSLGGGLAGLAGLVHDKISPVYAFNPSSVLGRGAILNSDFAEEEGNGLGVTLRIVEHGEVLACTRLFKCWFLPSESLDEETREYRFNLIDGDPVSQHDMRRLACRFRELEEPMR